MNAVRVGFEPTRLSPASFQDWCDRPLHHLTIVNSACLMSKLKHIHFEVRAGIVRRIGGLQTPETSRNIIPFFLLRHGGESNPCNRSFADSRVSTSPPCQTQLKYRDILPKKQQKDVCKATRGSRADGHFPAEASVIST